MAGRSFKERYEGQCAGFGKIYREQELAKEMTKRAKDRYTNKKECQDYLFQQVSQQ